MVHTVFVDTFMVYVHTELHLPTSFGSLIIAVKPEWPLCCWFTLYKKKSIYRSHLLVYLCHTHFTSSPSHHVSVTYERKLQSTRV